MMRLSQRELREARDRLEDLIERQAEERSFQELFSQCPYIISEALPVRVAPTDIVPMARPGKSEPDFIFFPKSRDSFGEFGVIEIKRPDSTIATVTRKNIVTLSRDAETAISQCQYFLHNLDPTVLAKPKESLMLGMKGNIFVIMGLSEQLYQIFLDDLMRQQLERRIPDNCRLLPYDIVLENFKKSIPRRVRFLVPAIEKRCRVAIMDGGMRYGSGVISEILSMFIQEGLGLDATVDEHMDPFLSKFKNRAFDVPIVIFNPEISELTEIWPSICSDEAYALTPFLFVSNPLDTDPDGVKRLTPYFRKGFDLKVGMPFRFPEIAETMHCLVERRSVALHKQESLSSPNLKEHS